VSKICTEISDSIEKQFSQILGASVYNNANSSLLSLGLQLTQKKLGSSHKKVGKTFRKIAKLKQKQENYFLSRYSPKIEIIT